MTETPTTSKNLLSQLKTITETSVGNGAPCPLGRVAQKLDEETRDALIKALRSEATTKDIHKALKQEGISIARQNIGKQRQCFTAPNDKQCKCYPNNTETHK
jgi:hypothetical protein